MTAKKIKKEKQNKKQKEIIAGAIMVECDPQNGCCQHLISEGDPACFRPLQDCLQDQ